MTDTGTESLVFLVSIKIITAFLLSMFGVQREKHGMKPTKYKSKTLGLENRLEVMNAFKSLSYFFLLYN